MRDRRVRGCMGALHPREPDWRTEIVRHALGALSQDTRFPIVDRGESDRFIVIVSLVGETRPLARLADLDPWSEGLLVEADERSAVLLPGEAKTARWEFSQACRLAGIDPAAPHSMTRFSTTTWIGYPEIAGASEERSSP
ncbi:AMMECR1 domain-containing protein [bacterium]|nr:AMMECR1 domain-containing protein [bacterium]